MKMGALHLMTSRHKYCSVLVTHLRESKKTKWCLSTCVIKWKALIFIIWCYSL